MDLIENIISRLPAKSLLRFKAVCRSWNDLISSPRFIKSHLQRSMDSPSQLRFFARHKYDPGRPEDIRDYIRHYPLLRLGDGEFEIESVLDIGAYFFIICSYDGMILCQGFRRQLLLWNPSSGKLTGTYNPYIQAHKGLCGFCRDRLNDDFKIVVLDWKCYGVFSCNAKSWTNKKSDHNSAGFTDRAGLCVDEAVYWLRIRKDGNQEIVWFDSRDDELKVMEKPQGVKVSGTISLLSFKHTLCACFYNVAASLLQIWSWNGTCWTEFTPIELAPTPFPFLRPLYFQENVILMQVDTSRFLIYHPIEKTFQEFEDASLGEIQGIIPYVESLMFISLERALPQRKRKSIYSRS